MLLALRELVELKLGISADTEFGSETSSNGLAVSLQKIHMSRFCKA